MKKVIFLSVFVLSIFSSKACYFLCLDGNPNGTHCFGGNGTCGQITGCNSPCECWPCMKYVYIPSANDPRIRVNNNDGTVVIQSELLNNGKEFNLINTTDILCENQVFEVFYDYETNLFSFKIFDLKILLHYHDYEGALVSSITIDHGF